MARNPAVVLLGALVVGGILAVSGMPWAYRALPHDGNRTSLVVDALKDGQRRPAVVIAGNSMIMNGVDGRQLATILGLSEPAINVATTGQSLLEAPFYMEMLPETARVLVLGLPIESLSTESHAISRNVYMAYTFSGYVPGALARDMVRSVAPENAAEILDDTVLEQAVAARWVVRAAFDSWARSALRSDLTLENGRDLYFPHTYSAPLKPVVMRALVERFSVPNDRFLISERSRAIIDGLIMAAGQRGIRLIWLVPPQNPLVRRRNTAAYYDGMRHAFADLRRSGADLLNLYDLLALDQFIDNVHPTKDGAAAVTHRLAEYLKTAPAPVN